MTRQPSRGFTLIELLVVVIIMAVMAGVAVPAYSRLSAKTRFDSTVSDVQDLFGYARELAVSKDTIVTLTYDAQGEVFRVTPISNGTPTDLPSAETNGANGQTSNNSMGNNAAMQGGVTRMVQLPPGYAVGFTAEADMTDPPQSGSQPEAGPNTVRFHGDGTSDGADVIVSSRDGDAVLKLSMATGRLKLVNPNGRQSN